MNESRQFLLADQKRRTTGSWACCLLQRSWQLTFEVSRSYKLAILRVLRSECFSTYMRTIHLSTKPLCTHACSITSVIPSCSDRYHWPCDFNRGVSPWRGARRPGGVGSGSIQNGNHYIFEIFYIRIGHSPRSLSILTWAMNASKKKSITCPNQMHSHFRPNCHKTLTLCPSSVSFNANCYS